MVKIDQQDLILSSVMIEKVSIDTVSLLRAFGLKTCVSTCVQIFQLR